MRYLVWLTVSLLALLLYLSQNSAVTPIPVSQAHGAAATATVQVPAGFTVTTVLADLQAPTDMVFLPTGAIFVLEKGRGADTNGQSQVRLIHNGLLVTQPVLTLSTTVTDEAGLTSIALDPNFVTNHYFYVWYTIGQHATGWSGAVVNRLSRFTFDSGSGTAGNEVIIIEDEPWGFHHHGGGMHFGADGYLYLGTGDRQRADKPFVRVADARPEIYAYGLRNPFRMAQRSSDGALFLIDVGDLAYEEVNQVLPKANYGWDQREGPCPKGKRLPCQPAAGYTDPVFYYEHSGHLGDAAIAALVFYEGDSFPAEYQQNLFYADFMQQVIRMAVLEQNGFTIKPFAEAAGLIVDLATFHEQLYVLTFAGELKLIHYTSAPNQPPVAQAKADVLVGTPPFAVRFSAEGSHDPDDLAFEYQWDFGDGTASLRTRHATVTHTYQTEGTYFARLHAVDLRGGKSAPVEVKITVYAGELPVIRLRNRTDPTRTSYYGGDEWHYEAVRSTLQGLDRTTPYLWRVDLLHDQHGHPIVQNQAATSGLLQLSREIHDGDNLKLHYQFQLLMKTATGQEIVVSRVITPALATLHIASMPMTTTLLLNQVAMTTPHHRQTIIGATHQLEAPPTLLYQGQIGTFDHWYIFADGWPVQAATPTEVIYDTQLTFSAPVTNTRYIAFYRYTKPAIQLWLPLVKR